MYVIKQSAALNNMKVSSTIPPFVVPVDIKGILYLFFEKGYSKGTPDMVNMSSKI